MTRHLHPNNHWRVVKAEARAVALTRELERAEVIVKVAHVDLNLLKHKATVLRRDQRRAEKHAIDLRLAYDERMGRNV